MQRSQRFDDMDIDHTPATPGRTRLWRGKRRYELSNHLGNVQSVISDKRHSICDEDHVERFVAV